MANKEQIEKAKEATKKAISEKISKNPNVGLYEFVGSKLSEMGYECPDISEPEDVRKAVSKLSPSDRKAILKDFKEYNEEYTEAVAQFTKGTHSVLTRLPKKAIEIITKGSAIGISAAGIVNTFVPGLFPTLAGYAAAIAPDIFVKAGLLTVGMFTPPALTAGTIVGIGAVTGAVVYSAAKGIAGSAKGIYKGIKKAHKHKSNDKEIGD